MAQKHPDRKILLWSSTNVWCWTNGSWPCVSEMPGRICGRDEGLTDVWWNYQLKFICFCHYHGSQRVSQRVSQRGSHKSATSCICRYSWLIIHTVTSGPWPRTGHFHRKSRVYYDLALYIVKTPRIHVPFPRLLYIFTIHIRKRITPAYNTTNYPTSFKKYR